MPTIANSIFSETVDGLARLLARHRYQLLLDQTQYREQEEAALVDGLSIWGAFLTIILPIALPGMVAAFILSLVLTWNEYFFAALLTSTHANTLPVMVASQTGSQGISWWSMAALSTGAILPLIVIGVVLERYIIKGMAAGAVK